MGSGVRLVFGAFVVTVALAVGVAAFAGGAPTIAAAPRIPLGQLQVTATAGVDYWRVPLGVGDRLTLRFGPPPQKSGWVQVCVHRPDVTDETVGNQPCHAI